ncbi:MAG: Asp23/Gls24 family envelope stress response protein [Acidobacteria bacterium]|nr:Asp23/Gls24 family envelope stress response protein [Acidobacteriota bacterium]
MATKTAAVANETAVAETVATATGLELETSRGVTHIADEVVAKLAGHACREIGGVAGMGATFRRLLGRVRLGEEPLSQGVHVEVGKKETAVDVVIVVQYGYSIPTLAKEVRDNVVARVESATGLVVKEVNIEIDDLRFENEPESSRVE